MTFDERWLQPGGIVPVDVETTALLIEEVRKWRNKFYGEAWTPPEGYKLVPKCATLAMHNAAAYSGFYKDPKVERCPHTGALSVTARCPDWSAVWKVMVDAA